MHTNTKIPYSRKVLFCGLGSIGQKHLRNLIRISSEQGVSLTVDALRYGQSQLSEDIASQINETYHSSSEVPEDYDIVFITNPTSLHYESILALQNKTKAMFIEKPVFNQLHDISKLNTQCVMYVACPLRHTAILRHIKRTIDLSSVFHVRAICSSYLPDWRPNVDYTKIYSADKNMGGGVELDLIHEWDYLIDLFNFPDEVTRMSGKYSSLNISSNDVAIYHAKQENRLMELHLDYFGHLPRRELELYSADNTYLIDINQSMIKDKTGKITSIPKEDMYHNELIYFLGLVDGQMENINNVCHAQQILGIAII